MKKLILVLALMSSTGCATLRTLAQEIHDNPAAALGMAINGIQTAITAAQAGFGIWEAVNPSAAGLSRATFNSLLSNVANGVRLAQTGSELVTAQNANQRLAAARDAMSELHTFLAGLSSNGTGSAASPEMQEALAATEAASHP